jgi:HSP20 family protein
MSRPGYWRREFAAPLNALQGELNRLFAHYRNLGLGPLGPAPAEPTEEIEPSATWVPAVDLIETPEEVVLWADLPGVDPAKVDLAVTGRVLTLRGEKAGGELGGGSRGHALERQSGPFFRQIPLPSDVDVEAIQAEAHNGVLRVKLPKAEAVRPRTIPVRPS